MRKLNILMPMGGLGKRFSDAGVAIPKPLIPVDGRPMFQKALDSFDDLDTHFSVTAVFRRIHDQEYHLSAELKSRFPDISILIIDELTRGAVETCVAAESCLEGSSGLIILDCDLYFKSPRYLECLKNSLSSYSPAVDGALAYFHASIPRYSFVKTAGERVVDIAEKRVISDQAVIGAYYFSKAKNFFEGAQRVLNAPPDGASEYYVSLVCKKMLNEGAEFHAYPSEQYYSFGTPEELSKYQRVS